jgi:hypothetical protein
MTIQPFLPKSWFTSKDLAALRHQGISCKDSYVESAKDSYYFFAEEGTYEPDETPDSDEFEEGEAVEFWQDLFQRKLEEHPEFEFIACEGAHWCDKTRPGAFGGFAILITATDVYEENTYSWLERTKGGL